MARVVVVVVLILLQVLVLGPVGVVGKYVQMGEKIVASDHQETSQQGVSLSLSADAQILAVGGVRSYYY